MWNTPVGQRILQGAEARAYGESVLELVDALRADHEMSTGYSCGIAAFDNLAWQQKFPMLLRVSRPLLVAESPEPPVSGIRDATVAAVYAQMLDGVKVEIDMQQMSTESYDEDTDRRIEVKRALSEAEPDRQWPDPECVVVEEWELAVMCLRDRVLPDEDWNLADRLLDLPPEQANAMKQALGIDHDYAIDTPPDADDTAVRSAWADLIELVTGERPGEDAKF